MAKFKEAMKKILGRDPAADNRQAASADPDQLGHAEKMKIIDELASGLAHEVKNPLAIILQGVDFLASRVKNEDPNVAVTIEYIQDAIKRVDKLIGEFLDFSSISGLNIELTDLNEVINNSLLLIHNQLEANKIEVVKNYRSDVLEIRMDKNRITQVLVNLMLNAVQAMPQGGKLTLRSYIDRSLETNNGQGAIAVAEVEDSGIGIPEEDLPKVFDFFYTSRRSKGNIGLGLSTAKNIMDMHGGSINLQNRKDNNGIKAIIRLKA